MPVPRKEKGPLMDSVFQTRHKPLVGVPVTLESDIRVITAPNASPMTFTGTQTYLVGTTDLAIIDPGPNMESHLQAILAAVLPGQQITQIMVTHSHIDHSPLAPKLSAETGAGISAFGPHDAARNPLMNTLGELGGGEGIDERFCPDHLIAHGDIVSGEGFALEAVHLPGHLSNHLGFATSGRLFSGDCIMGWASTMISPPDGDLTAFMQSLDHLSARQDQVYYPGHGAGVHNPMVLVDHIRNHRLARTTQILRVLQQGPRTVADITAEVYRDVPPKLHNAASRNVLAHLIDLYSKNEITSAEEFHADATFGPAS